MENETSHSPNELDAFADAIQRLADAERERSPPLPEADVERFARVAFERHAASAEASYGPFLVGLAVVSLLVGLIGGATFSIWLLIGGAGLALGALALAEVRRRAERRAPSAPEAHQRS